MRLFVNSKSEEASEDKGILYLVLFQVDGKDLVKIGITTRTIEERVSEILVSIFKVYREFPYCRPKRFKKTTDIFEKESILHRYFDKYRHKTEKAFSGSSEFFDIPLEDAVTAYEYLLSGGSLVDEGEYRRLQDS